MRAENPFNQEIQKSRLIRVFKKIFFQYFLFKLINRFLFIGTQNHQFYLYYGVNSTKLIYAPYCVNNNFFLEQYAKVSELREEFRRKYHLQEKMVILYSGKYISKKRPLDLLNAYTKLTDHAVALVMVGEGELRESMQAFIDQNHLKNVTLTGFVNQSEISNFYSLADIFVLSSGSGETWGLVVNEAMLFNLPIVVTDTAGCSIDLVKPVVNGFIYEEGNVGQLVESLTKLINDKEFRSRAGRESGKIIEQYNYGVMIENMKKELNE